MPRRMPSAKAMNRRWKWISREVADAARLERDGRPTTFETMGRRWAALEFDSVKATNDFLERNPEYGVIAEPERDRVIYVARLEDMGTPIEKETA